MSTTSDESVDPAVQAGIGALLAAAANDEPLKATAADFAHASVAAEAEEADRAQAASSDADKTAPAHTFAPASFATPVRLMQSIIFLKNKRLFARLALVIYVLMYFYCFVTVQCYFFVIACCLFVSQKPRFCLRS